MKRNTRKCVRFDAPKQVERTSWNGGTYKADLPTIKQLPLGDFVNELFDAAEGIENPMVYVEWQSLTIHGTRDETPKERERREARLAKKVALAQAEVEKAEAKLAAAKAGK